MKQYLQCFYAIKDKRTLALLFYTSFLFFFLEVVFFAGLRFATTYFNAQLIIAIGLLGLIFGGIGAAYIRRDRLRRAMLYAVPVLVAVPFVGMYGIILSPTHFWLSTVLLSAVFTPIGFIIGIAYRFVDPWQAYAIELFGGISGLIAALFLIPLVREENAALFAAGASMMFAASVFWRRAGHLPARILILSFVIFTVALFISNVKNDYFNFAVLTQCAEHQRNPSITKIFCFRDFDVEYHVLRSMGSIVDRIDIVSLDNMPKLITAFSGTPNDLIRPLSEEHYTLDARIPNVLFDEPRTLIIGAGAEGIVKTIKSLGARDITVVDLNPAVLNLWKRDRTIKQYAHNPFEGVRSELIDGRAFLETRDDKFDLITMLNTHRTRNIGEFGEPDFLHTEEAFKSLLGHLTLQGLLVFEEPNFSKVSEEAIVRVIGSLRNALHRMGIQEPEQHIIVYEWGGAQRKQQKGFTFPYVQFIVKKNPWTSLETEELETWAGEFQGLDGDAVARDLSFNKWLWMPQKSRYNATSTSQVAAAVAGGDVYGQNANTLVDLSPFPIQARDTGGMLLWRSLAVFGSVLLAAFLWWLGRTRSRPFHGRIMFPSFFILIGLGYMLVEIFLIQLFQFYLGSVLLAFLSSIGGLFAASAAGSLLIGRQKIRRARFLWIFASLAIMTLGILLAVPMAFFVSSLSVRFIISFLFAVGTGAFLCVFFPYGIMRARAQFSEEMPLLVGLNGSAMAVGVPLSFALASTFGLPALIVGAGVSYAVAIFFIHAGEHKLMG